MKAKHTMNSLRRRIQQSWLVSLVLGFAERFPVQVPGLMDVLHKIWHWIELAHVIEYLLHARTATTIVFVVGLVTSWEFIVGVVVGVGLVILFARGGGADDDDHHDEMPGPPPAPALALVVPFPAKADDEVEIPAAS